MREVRYTNAPEAYDGFGTKTLRVVGTDKRDRPIREVSIEPDHFKWQSMRYRSGMHPCWTREQLGELQDLLDYNVTL